MTMTEREVYQKAIEKYGFLNQRMMLVEECGELLNEIAKANRGRTTVANIITELADVSIMVEQMAEFFGVEAYQKEKERKIERLKERLGI